jgi:hypothetical protein
LSAAHTIVLEIREAKRARLYDHLGVFGVIALVSLGAFSQAVPDNLSLPVLWLGYFAAAALAASVTAFASARIFHKTIVLRDNALEVRRTWGTTIWNLEGFDDAPHLEMRPRGYFDLVFHYRSARVRSRRITVPLVYVERGADKTLLEALKTALQDFHIANNRAAFVQRQSSRGNHVDG